jgi:hypothetical protein
MICNGANLANTHYTDHIIDKLAEVGPSIFFPSPLIAIPLFQSPFPRKFLNIYGG